MIGSDVESISAEILLLLPLHILDFYWFLRECLE